MKEKVEKKRKESKKERKRQKFWFGCGLVSQSTVKGKFLIIFCNLKCK